MPELILDLMAGLRCSDCSTIREFYVLRDRGEAPGPGIRFAFYEEDDKDLVSKLGVLVEGGYVVPVASEGPPLYRITEEFANKLLEGWPERRWPDWCLAMNC